MTMVAMQEPPRGQTVRSLRPRWGGVKLAMIRRLWRSSFCSGRRLSVLILSSCLLGGDALQPGDDLSRPGRLSKTGLLIGESADRIDLLTPGRAGEPPDCDVL